MSIHECYLSLHVPLLCIAPGPCCASSQKGVLERTCVVAPASGLDSNVSKLSSIQKSLPIYIPHPFPKQLRKYTKTGKAKCSFSIFS